MKRCKIVNFKAMSERKTRPVRLLPDHVLRQVHNFFHLNINLLKYKSIKISMLNLVENQRTKLKTRILLKRAFMVRQLRARSWQNLVTR